MEITIDAMQDKYWQSIRAIYSEGIRTGNATFETKVPTKEAWNKDHLEECRLVAKRGDKIVAWAALSPVSGRCIYAGVAEVSIYVSAKFRGRGIGKQLLQALIEDSEHSGIWTLQAGIFPENKASVSIHESLGFRIVGLREKIGRLDGIWRDVILMERRSKIVGIS